MYVHAITIYLVWYCCIHAGCPSVVRCDYGTENISIASTQIAFQFYHTDSRAGVNSFIYGPSKANIVSYSMYASVYTKRIFVLAHVVFNIICGSLL